MFYWINALVHTAQKVQWFLTKKNNNQLLPPPYCPDLAPADYFLFQTLKMELVDLTMTLDKFQMKWEGGHQDSDRRRLCQGVPEVAAVGGCGRGSIIWQAMFLATPQRSVRQDLARFEVGK